MSEPIIKMYKVPGIERYKQLIDDVEDLKIQVQSIGIALQAIREEIKRSSNSAHQAASAALYVANLNGR